MQAKNSLLTQTVSPVIYSQHWSLSNKESGFVKDMEDINQSLHNIWNTEIGSDILRPDFGCNWQRYIDYPIDEAPIYIIRELMLATAKWEPRVIIKGITYHNQIEHIFFKTRYALNEKIAGELIGRNFNVTIEGIL